MTGFSDLLKLGKKDIQQ